jgi:hypothetical protein
MTDFEHPDAAKLADWFGDAANAEPCATFPLDPCGALDPGIYAFHGDAVANEVIGLVVGCHVSPLFVDHAGGRSPRTGRASGATLESAVGRTHLGGTTQSSSFRRSLAAVVWDELDLRCERPKRLDTESNRRLTAWMVEHLGVVTMPFLDRSSLTVLAADIGHRLAPHFNLTGYPNCAARQRIRELRSRHFKLATADDERIQRITDMQRLAKLDPGDGDFLRRRIQQEVEKLKTDRAS